MSFLINWNNVDELSYLPDGFTTAANVVFNRSMSTWNKLCSDIQPCDSMYKNLSKHQRRQQSREIKQLVALLYSWKWGKHDDSQNNFRRYFFWVLLEIMHVLEFSTALLYVNNDTVDIKICHFMQQRNCHIFSCLHIPKYGISKLVYYTCLTRYQQFLCRRAFIIITSHLWSEEVQLNIWLS